HDEHVLVVGAVENADPAALRQAPHVAPQEVVVQLLGRGLFEAEYLAALGVHARHDVLDRPVLAGRVHRLEDNQHGIPVVRVQKLLRLLKVLEALVQDCPGAFLDLGLAQLLHLPGLGPAGVVVLEANLFPRRDAEEVNNVLWDHGFCPCCATGHALAPQISAGYLAIVGSLENLPEQATLTIALRAQASGSAYSSPTRCWAWAYDVRSARCM